MKKISVNMMKIVVVLMIGIFAIGMSLGVNAAEVKEMLFKVKGDFEYELNEEIDVDKFKVIAVNDEGWEKDLTEEVEFEFPEMSELGEHEVLVRYGEIEFTFIISLVEEAEELPEGQLAEQEVLVEIEEAEEEPEEEPEEEEEMEDVVEDVTSGGFDLMGTMSGIMEFLQPLLDTLLNSILPMIMNTVLPMAVDAASTLIPMAIDVGVPAITTLIGLIL